METGASPSARRERRRALSATLALVAAIALLAGGAAVAAAAYARRAAPEAERDGVVLRVERAVWLDHGAAGAHTHLPGMPGAGFHRLAVSFVVENRASAERRFRWQSLSLGWPRRSVQAASHDGRATVVLPPGHVALLEAWFDVPETKDVLTLAWEDMTSSARLLTTQAPVHALRRDGRVVWPARASELPRGKARSGERLFRDKCQSCHGDPAAPGSNVAAPHLAGIGRAAASRLPGIAADQYLYESMIDPDAHHQHTCDGRPGCEEPPPMPSYGETLSLQEAADLVAFLLAQGPR